MVAAHNGRQTMAYNTLMTARETADWFIQNSTDAQLIKMTVDAKHAYTADAAKAELARRAAA